MEMRAAACVGEDPTNPYKDDYYRSLCVSPTEYDKVIDWIAVNNPYADHKNAHNMGAEEFAAHVVHSCIRAVCFGDGGTYAETGMAIAIKSPTATRISGCPKVKLTINCPPVK